MIILDGAEEFKKHDHTIVTIGTFDGVHFGHRKILSKIVNQAREQNGISVVVTFWPHPRLVLEGPKSTLQLLTTFEEKARIMAEIGVDVIVKIPFTLEFSKTTSEEFIQKILIDQIGTKKLVIGYDHHFGKDREGSFEYLKANSKRFGFEVEEIPRQDIDHVGVSSTKIRQALLEGDITTTNEYMGRPYHFSGEVIHGEKMGRDLGYPTANIKPVETFKIIPGDGIYVVEVRLEQRRFYGMLYIGNKPTLEGRKKSIEVNIFDFNEDIYGDTLEIYMLDQLRGDIKFPGVEELKKQLDLDKKNALAIINNLPQ